MGIRVEKGNHPMSGDAISKISDRYLTITKAINREFWDSDSKTAHSRYVGSYGRGTAVKTSDLDVLHVLPNSEYERFTSASGNGQSRLLQAVKGAVQSSYPRTSVSADGQVVVVVFSDDMKFEILPAFKSIDWLGNWDGTYKYPDTNMGGNWKSTNPVAEQEAMRKKNSQEESNGLLMDTCRHIRYIKNEALSSYHLSGILVDSFVYTAMGNWHWLRKGERGEGQKTKTYEETLLDYFDNNSVFATPVIYAPGSGDRVDTEDWEVLGKVLRRMV